MCIRTTQIEKLEGDEKILTFYGKQSALKYDSNKALSLSLRSVPYVSRWSLHISCCNIPTAEMLWIFSTFKMESSLFYDRESFYTD